MNIFNIISWIQNQVSSLINSIKQIARDLKNGLSDLRAWVMHEISGLLKDAEAFTRYLVDGVKSWVMTLVNNVLHTSGSLFASARTYAQLLVDSAKAFLLDRIDEVKIWLAQLDERLRSGATDFVNGLIAGVKDWTSAELSPILDELKKLQEYLPILKNITALFSARNFSRLADMLDRMYGMLFNFIDDPIKFIYSLLKSTFTNFLCFALAYGLGTVEETLPPWTLGSGKDFAKGGEYAPPGTYQPSGLVSPLANLWISGYTFGPNHHAVDLGAIAGEPVFAMHDGTITEAGWSSVGYGFTVVISGDKWWSRYAHLQEINVQVGQTVTAGVTIGLANSTGNSTGNHLHLEIKRGGQWVDPVTVLPIGG